MVLRGLQAYEEEHNQRSSGIIPESFGNTSSFFTFKESKKLRETNIKCLLCTRYS